jgi:hypothetical protein
VAVKHMRGWNVEARDAIFAKKICALIGIFRGRTPISQFLNFSELLVHIRYMHSEICLFHPVLDP